MHDPLGVAQAQAGSLHNGPGRRPGRAASSVSLLFAVAPSAATARAGNAPGGGQPRVTSHWRQTSRTAAQITANLDVRT